VILWAVGEVGPDSGVFMLIATGMNGRGNLGDFGVGTKSIQESARIGFVQKLRVSKRSKVKFSSNSA